MRVSLNMLVALLIIISIIISILAWIALSNYGIIIPTSEGDKSEQKQDGDGGMGSQVMLTILPTNQSFPLNKSLNKNK